jgi:MFS family permease
MTDEGQSGELETAAGQAEVKRYFWRNYLAHGVDGGFFRGAVIVTSATTILPKIISELHGPTWLITTVPIMMTMGFTAPALFTAHWIDRATRYMPLLLITGIFQRLPFLIAGLALMLCATDHPTVALAAVALAPLISGLSGGLTMPAWQQLVVRTIPENRRSSLFGFRFMLACILGLTGGWVVKVALEAYPGTTGYGILHLYSFAALAISYIAFAMIRETNVRPPTVRADHGMWQNLRDVPALIRAEPNVRMYLLAVGSNCGMFILIPFITIRACDVLQKSDDFMGDLVIAQMLGAILGNVVAGYLGDRYGGRLIMMIGQATFLVTAIWSAVAGTVWEFYAAFVIFGFSQNVFQISNTTLNMTICPERRRSTYLAIILAISAPCSFGAAMLAAAVGDAGDHYKYLLALTIPCLLTALLTTWRVREPRKTAVVEA